MKKRILILLLIVCFTIGISYAADLNETLSEDTKQWLRDNQDKWWAKEVVSFLDLGQDIIDLKFSDFITDTVDYYKHSDDYINYKLNPKPPISDDDFTVSFQVLNFLLTNTYSDEPYYIGNKAYINPYDRNPEGKLYPAAIYDISNNSLNISLSNPLKRDLKYTWDSNFRVSCSGNLYISFNKDMDVIINISSSGGTLDGISSSIGTLQHYSKGTTISTGFSFGSNGSNSLLGYGSFIPLTSVCSVNVSIGGTPAPERPTYNNTYVPNINTYLDSNNNWVNNYAENQYHNITNIYNDITNEISEKENYLNNVVEDYGTPDVNRPSDTSSLINYPSDFLGKLKNVLVNGYSSTFKFHLNEVVFKEHVIIPNVDLELDPRDLFGDLWNLFSYIIVFLLTIPWIVWFILKIRGESDL